MLNITHTHTLLLIVSESQDFPPQLFLTRHHTLLNDRPLPCQQFSPFPLYQSPQHTLTTFPQKKKKKAHFFHFCPCFSAVSTTTVAENIPQKDSANGVGCCLGGCIIGVSGASSLCLCILDVYVSMYVCMYVGRGYCVYMNACSHAFAPARICAG